ncbi:hypothetical protein RUM43_013319 [Polyplax serrata]|uniref:Uncharacterized protein n=1 Tax=Polyplax serrata TaxID=468196 RepID=A0AAN8S702_POLSC
MATRQENEAPNPAGRRAHEGHRRGRPGQGAKARNQDRFRSMINSKQATEDRTGIEQRYGLTEEGAVEKLFASVEYGESGYAVLLPVATRGIGFASVLEYQRFADAESISVYAYYRVMLHLFHLKLSLSYRSQTLAPNHPMDMIQPLSADDLNLLMGVSQVPLATYTILHDLGTAHTPDDYYPVLRSPQVSYNWVNFDPEELYNIGIQWALGLDIYNIRSILEQLSNPDTPLPVRTGFIDCNPIPGARWTDMLLTNMNSIWPENYDYGQLSFDIRSYQLLLANASNKVFKGFIRLSH